MPIKLFLSAIIYFLFSCANKAAVLLRFNREVFSLWKLFPYMYYFKPISPCYSPPELGLIPDSKNHEALQN